MHLFSPQDHHRHVPTWYVSDGVARPGPDVPTRVDAIRHALAHHTHTSVTCDHTTLQHAARIHDLDYLTYLRTIYGLWSAEFGPHDVLPDTFVPRGLFVPRPSKPSAQAGYYCFDMAAPIGPHTADAALASAACALAAVNHLLTTRQPAYALCRPPGHHAGRDYCGGFCYLNNIAIAADLARARGAQRVAIFDVDYHHGNGTQDIFYARNDVLFASIHAEPDTQYPYFWGHASERGIGPGEGFNLNLPLPRGTNAPTWFHAFTLATRAIKNFSPDILLISLGVDTYRHDGVGDFQLDLPDFTRLGQQLADLKLPTVLIQEGGYNVDAVGTCVANVLNAF